MKNTWKKLVAMTLAASMTMGMLGVGTLAADETGEEKQSVSAEGTYEIQEDTKVTSVPEETETTVPPAESEVSNGDEGIMLLAEEDEAQVDPAITAFLAAVAEIPEEITEENWKDAKAKVDAARELYGPVYDLYVQDKSIWTGELPVAYKALKAADAAVLQFKLAAYPITGAWSEDENGKVLTLTGTDDSAYIGTFVLVEDGQRVKFVSNLRTDTTLAPFRVVLEGVTEIGNSAFSGCKKLTGINLEGVTTIGDSAFSSAFDPNADVTITLNGAAVGAFAFNKSNIDHLVATGLTAIGKQAFLGTTVQDVEIGVADGAELSQDFFYNSKQLTTLDVTGDLLMKNSFRNCSALETVTLNDVTEIGENAFMDCPKLGTVTGLGTVTRIEAHGFYRDTALTTVDLSGVKTIGYDAFNGTSLSGDYDLSGAEHIEFNAFKGCENANITVGENTVLEHSDVFTKIPGLSARIAAILAGKFALNPANAIDTLEPLGWTSSKIGTENDHETYGGTQLTKEARWADEDSTVADVTIQAYYTDVAQMDFIFVLDLSNSMAKVGNVEAGDKNARLYDMQSKLLDVTDKLMTTPGYDCHVAFTGFGETSSLTSGQFFTEAGEAAEYINGLQTYYENTNYGLGLEKARALVEANTGRSTTVVFLSDGQPYAGANKPIPDGYYGYGAAQAIKDAGVEIYAVLQSIPADELANAQNVMKKICTGGKFFTANQTSEFSEAVNNAIACGFTTYTLVDTVGDDFDLAQGTVRASAGEVTISEDGRTITWTITGMPFETHTLTFQENLKQVNGAYPYGSFDTNANDAELKLGDETVNQVETPVLPRTEPTPTPDPTETPTPDPDPTDDPDPVRPTPDPEPTVTPSPEPTGTPEPTPSETPVIEELGENDTPLAELPTETEEPAAEPPKEEFEELEDEDVPMAQAPETGDNLGTWLMMSAGALLGLAWLGKKKEEA